VAFFHHRNYWCPFFDRRNSIAGEINLVNESYTPYFQRLLPNPASSGRQTMSMAGLTQCPTVGGDDGGQWLTERDLVTYECTRQGGRVGRSSVGLNYLVTFGTA
jgi:hypothetical protein